MEVWTSKSDERTRSLRVRQCQRHFLNRTRDSEYTWSKFRINLKQDCKEGVASVPITPSKGDVASVFQSKEKFINHSKLKMQRHSQWQGCGFCERVASKSSVQVKQGVVSTSISASKEGVASVSYSAK